MASLGANARLLPAMVQCPSETGWIGRAGGIVLVGGFVPLPAFGAARDDTRGKTAVPSLRMTRAGRFEFLWPVEAGARSISVQALQVTPSTPRPQLIVKANPAVGLAADLVATASAGASWVTVGPVSFTAAAAGTLRVELWCLAPGTQVECWWDDVVAR